jgi:hypothetical protein
MIETVFITEGNLHPHEAEKINLPTILGALQGRELAEGIEQDKLCSGCAFRIGAAANQCLSTTSDAHYCVEDSDHFYCHINLDDKGEPTNACAGYAIKMKQVSAT